jgi:hypothetical protein
MLGWMQRLRPGTKNRRILDRRARNDAVYIFGQNRLLGQAALLDDSTLGVRLRSSTPGVLEAAEFMLDSAHARVFRLQPAWREGSEAGYAIESETNLRGFITDPAIVQIRAFWMQVSFEHGAATHKGVFGRPR